jgi:signal transduction histidine kinase/signal recognition particle receptor subunit beta/CheY-like chemotaxis protein
MTTANQTTKELEVKIVYYGPAMAGKTTNLVQVHDHVQTAQGRKGKLVSMATSSDRTLFFDFLPIEGMAVKGFKTKFQLYTVPGQVIYNTSRQLVLRGVDGIVFVADSQSYRMEENAKSLQNLKENLKRLNLNLADIPLVFQYNKRDLPDVAPVEFMDYLLNDREERVPSFTACACKSEGVFETLNLITRMLLQKFLTQIQHLNTQIGDHVLLDRDIQSRAPATPTDADALEKIHKLQKRLTTLENENATLAAQLDLHKRKDAEFPKAESVSGRSSEVVRTDDIHPAERIDKSTRLEADVQKLAAFARRHPNPFIELAFDGTVNYLNDAARDIFQILRVANPAELLGPQARSICEECLREGRNKLSHQIQINGRTMTWSFFPIVGGQVIHCYGSDVTERLDLEAQLRHAQKLESVGQLAAGVAHDFNNILTIIQGHTERVLTQLEANSFLADPLKQVSAAAKRASSLTQQLLMFSRKQKMHRMVLDLNKVIGNLGNMLQHLIGHDIALETKFASPLPLIEADTGMIEQIIMNLSVNARDAMPKGGRLIVTTAEVSIDETHIGHNPDARAGRFVRLSVTDTGTGMSPETLERIFEPFFTTKEVGKGTGLGLATVYGIVKQHQGWVEIRSELKVGTTFTVFLPASEKTSSDAALDKLTTKPAVKGGNETVLLVEDEPVLRELAKVILEDYDYEVFEASSGVEALKVWDQRQGKVDLLLTNIVMPEGMTGHQLAEQLKARKPDLKVVYTSGYSFDVIGGDMEMRDAMFLQKPYPPPLLAKTVRQCLDL